MEDDVTPSESVESHVESGQPVQFQLRHLLWLTLGFAVVLAVLAPWLRTALPGLSAKLQASPLGRRLVFLLPSLFICSLAGMFVFRRRQALRQEAGSIVFRAQQKSHRYLYRVLTAVVALQLLVFLGIILPQDRNVPVVTEMLWNLNVCGMAAMCFSAYIQRTPQEFREFGVLMGLVLVRWKDVTRWCHKGDPPKVQCYLRTSMIEFPLPSIDHIQQIEKLVGQRPRERSYR